MIEKDGVPSLVWFGDHLSRAFTQCEAIAGNPRKVLFGWKTTIFFDGGFW